MSDTIPTALQAFSGKALAAVELARMFADKLDVDTSSDEEFITADGMLKQMTAFTKEFAVAFREVLTERLKKHGDIDMGDGRRWYAGKVKKVSRTIEPANLFDALMEAAGGDIDRVAVCLSVNFAKPAEVRELSPELYVLSYTEEYVLDTKTGKAKRQPVLTR